MTAPNLETLFAFEKRFEESFRAILDGAGCPKVNISREKIAVQTPDVDLKFIVGEPNILHTHGFNDGRRCYDSFACQLEVRITTHRINNGDQHAIIIGKVRLALSYFMLLVSWPLTEGAKFHAITNIQPEGNLAELDDENDLDITTMPFYVLANIRDDAWPVDTE